MNLQAQKQIMKLVFEEAVVEKEQVWFSAFHTNALVSFSPEDGGISTFSVFPDEHPTGGRLFGTMATEGNHIIFVPSCTDSITIYNKRNNGFHRVTVPDADDYSKACGLFYTVVKYGGFLYLPGAEYRGILKFNLATEECTLIDDFIPVLKQYKKKDDLVMFRKGACLAGHVLYVPYQGGNAVLALNLVNDCCKVYEIDAKADGFGDMAFDGKDFWLTPMTGGPVIRWSPEKGVTGSFQNYPEGFEGNTFRITAKNGIFWLIPLDANMLLRLDPVSGEMKEISAFTKLLEKKTAACWSCSEWKSGILICEMYSNRIFCLDCFSEEITEIFLHITEHTKFPHLEKRLIGQKNEIVYETADLCGHRVSLLPVFLDLLSKGEYQAPMQTELSGTTVLSEDCGSIIYRTLTEELKDTYLLTQHRK